MKKYIMFGLDPSRQSIKEGIRLNASRARDSHNTGALVISNVILQPTSLFNGAPGALIESGSSD